MSFLCVKIIELIIENLRRYTVSNIKSATKRIAVAEKKNKQNKPVKSEVSTTIKKFNDAIAKNDPILAEKLLSETFAVIDKAASKGTIHKNNAANKKSALAKKLSDLKTGKLVIVQKIDMKAKAAAKKAAETALKEERKQAILGKEKAKEAKKEAEKKKPKEKAKKADVKADKKTEPKADKKAEAKADKKTEDKAEAPAKAKAKKTKEE